MKANDLDHERTRRWLLAVGGGLVAAQFGSPALAASAANLEPNAALVRKATEALQRHGSAITTHDVIAIADFSAPSINPAFTLFRWQEVRPPAFYSPMGEDLIRPQRMGGTVF